MTHRAVEQAAGVPSGTASNYFRSREALLVAAAHRVVELHHADLDGAGTPDAWPGVNPAADELVDLLAASLLTAATTHRTRYQAIYELQLESVRRPALASALAGLADSSARLTALQHTEQGLPIPAEAIPALMTLYGGTLFTLITTPVEHLSAPFVRGLAHAIVHGALPAIGDDAPAQRKARRGTA